MSINPDWPVFLPLTCGFVIIQIARGMMHITDMVRFGSCDHSFTHVGAGRGNDQVILIEVKCFPNIGSEESERRIQFIEERDSLSP